MSDAILFALVLALLGCLVWFVFWWKDRAYVRKLSVDELEREAFRFDDEYFQFLGLHKPQVIRYRELVDSRDLESLSREWRHLSRDFQKLERMAGHRDRPLIMDYFGPQEMIYAELSRRRS